MLTVSDTLADMTRRARIGTEKKESMSARIDPQVLRAVESIADADDRSVSYIVEKALREYVEKHSAAAKPAKAPAKR